MQSPARWAVDGTVDAATFFRPPWCVNSWAGVTCDDKNYNVVDLDLDTNELGTALLLSNRLPSTIGALTALKSLSLNGQKVFGTIPTALATISTLTYLDLKGNRYRPHPHPLTHTRSLTQRLSLTLTLTLTYSHTLTLTPTHLLSHTHTPHPTYPCILSLTHTPLHPLPIPKLPSPAQPPNHPPPALSARCRYSDQPPLHSLISTSTETSCRVSFLPPSAAALLSRISTWELIQSWGIFHHP